jgi:prolyl-tRNA editing enzyme YbaK/EbsC (Cys-tRNA(Pro) deacylase)
MTDIELQALAALVNALAAETIAANDARKASGCETMAYEGFAGPDEMKALRDELVRCGVLKW